MIAGPSVDRLHWVPKSEGGRATDFIHVICHRMIHRMFDEHELATVYADPEAVRAHPEIARFVLQAGGLRGLAEGAARQQAPLAPSPSRFAGPFLSPAGRRLRSVGERLREPTRS